MRKYFFVLFIGLLSLNVSAQFPPAAGMEGTTAIAQDSSIFIAWANKCQIQRGYLDIANPDLGLVDYGTEEYGIGHADQNAVSLGDGGVAILEFEQPIINGPGADFAIFENSFSDGFLELALVYVSSNGVDYDLFPAISLTQTETQIDGFGIIEARKIHNLAGKYRGGYGTPFDLEELERELGREINEITHIKIIDAIGTIQEDFAILDSQNHIINEPYPTPFPSGGFDLDAIGIIHQATPTHQLAEPKTQILIYPNPNRGHFKILNHHHLKIYSSQIFNLQGELVYQVPLDIQNTAIDLDLPRGVYYLKVSVEFACDVVSFVVE